MLTSIPTKVRRFMLGCFLLAALSSQAMGAYPTGWEYHIGFVGHGVTFAVDESATDGYDGLHYDIQGSTPLPGEADVHIYHPTGPDWSGATGLYGRDTRSPIDPAVGYKTWDDIYLWSQGTGQIGNRAGVICAPGTPSMPPWYHAFLYLDYVPQSAGWTGPMVFELDTQDVQYLNLPIVAVTNPLDGVRMHFTVVTPEPSSVLALGLPALGMAGMLLRRRRR